MPVDITAMQAAQLDEDLDGDGVADPGDIVKFSVTIENEGDTDATGIIFAENLEGVTLVPGSINVSPIAFADAYKAVGNVQLTITAGSGLMANDVEFLSDTFAVTSVEVGGVSDSVPPLAVTTANGGTVTVNSNGSFSYASAAGFTGTDSFEYTVTDSKGLTSTATVEVEVGPSVWFIDNTAPGSTNVGTQANPFTSIAAFNAAQGTANGPQPGEIIYLRAGTYNEPDGINLTAGQTLIGQGEDLVVTPPGGLPQTIETGSPGETPIIQVTGDGNEAIQLSINNSIKGLDLDVVNATADGIEDGGVAVGKLTISNVEIKGVGQAVDIDQGGELDVQLDSVTSTGSSEEGIQLVGTSGSFTASTVSLSGSTGDAVDLDGNTGTVVINGGSIAAGNANSIAVDIAGGANTVTIAANVTDTNSNDIVEITGRTGGTVTLSGNITASGGTNNGIDINGNTGGTVNFTGAVNLATGANSAVNLSSNTGATVNFNTTGNGLDISTTSGTGFSATGGGTVTVVGAGNTISSGTGTALNVANTTIGAADLTFQSISANGAASGIVLNNTGASGGLTVTGDGGGSNNGSGGTIQNTTGDGISLTATDQVRLGYMNITNNLGDGIGGNDVNGFLLNRVNITGNGNNAATDESGINITELTGGTSGSATPTGIVNSVISNNNEFELQITNTSGTLTDFQLNNNTISSNGLPINGNASSPHGNLVNFLALGSANMTLNTNGGTYTGNWNAASPPATITATAIQADHSGTSGTLTVNINGGTFTNNNVAVSVSAANGGGIVFDVDGTTSTGNRSHGLNLFVAANSTGVVAGSFTDNTVGTLGVDGSGSALGFGIRVQNEAVATANPVTVEIDGNTVQETEQFSAININQGIAGQASSRTTNATITDNIIRQVDSGRAIVVQQNNTTNTTSAGITNLDIHGNALDQATIAGQVGDGTVIRLRELSANGGDMNVVQLAPTAAANAAELDNANGFNESSAGAEISLSGSIDFGQSAPPLPLLAAPGGIDLDAEVPGQPGAPDLPTVETPADPAPAAPETPETPAAPVDGNQAVSASELAFMVEAARARWAAAGLSADQAAALAALTFSIEDMSGLYLGAFRPGHVTLDSDAAGYGWFVDATPGDDAEFAITGTRGLLTATAEGGAAGHMDLLATIMHEMGHALGLEDTYALSDRGDIMYGYLSAGFRRVAEDGRADGAVIGAVTSEEFIGAPISIGTLPSGQKVVIEWQARVDEQTGQFVVDPVNFGTVEGGNFPAENTNGVTTIVDDLTLSGTLFNDLDSDGTQDAGEPGISGVTMSIYVDANNDNVADGVAIGTAVTDGSGNYSFVGLAPGNYIVDFNQIGTLPSASPSGGDPDNDTDNDSNGTLAAGRVSSQAITLSYNGENVADGTGQLDINNTLDFGVFNAAPAINNLAGDAASWTEGDAAVVLDQGTAAAIVDDGAKFNGGSLTVSVTANEDASEDLLGISTAGTVSLSAGLSAGSIVSVGGIGIGVISTGGAAGDDLVVDLNTSDATSARLAVLLSAITYVNIGGDDPTAGARTVTFTVEDSNGAIGSANVAVGVAVVDDPAVAVDDAVLTSESAPLVGASVFVNNGGGADSDPDSPLVVSLVNGAAFSDGVPITLASGALLTINANGSFDYDPNDKFNALPGPASGASILTAEDTFTYTLAGGGEATVTITISGEDSDGDVLEDTPGADALQGGIGSDTYHVQNSTDAVTELVGEGDADRVITSADFTLAAGQEVEILETSNVNGTEPINLRGNALQQTIEGNNGNNILHDGGTGPLPDDGVPDTLIGHGGDDRYSVYDPQAVIVEDAGEGNDRVAAGVNYVLQPNVSVEYLNTTSLHATYAVNLTGNNLVQWMRGNDGANVLDGGGGSDNIFGMGGNDIFRFSTNLGPDNVDRLRDFDVTDDNIELDHAIFAELALGPLAASAFKDVFLAAKDADDRIIYNSKTGGLFYDHDGAGGDAAVKFASITFASPGQTLTAADFVVI